LDGLRAEGGVAAAAKCAALVCVATIGEADSRAAGGAARDGSEVASWCDAGADGVILQLTPPAPPGEAADPIAEEARLAAVLGRVVERWSR
jgi:hypothetical protein